MVSLSFDTTPTNTGKDLGATTLIEQFVGRPLLWLACRHHSSELILMRAFEIIMHFDTKSPGVEIFKKFQREFEDILIDSENFNRLEVEVIGFNGVLEVVVVSGIMCAGASRTT